jgi:hypothetical protein
MLSMRKLVFISLIFSSVVVVAQPATEIYLFDLDINQDKIVIRNPKNITNHPGYDNQPFFHPNKTALYFVSADDQSRTDIYEYNYSLNTTRRITQTHDKEYSPTVNPDQLNLSCILQTDSGAQHLIQYPLAGGNPKKLIGNKIVGYHAWADANQVMIFSLPQPFKLELVNISSGESIPIAEGIGRSIHKIPGRNVMSFVKKISDTEYDIQLLDLVSLSTTLITKAIPGKEHDMSWTPDGRIFMSIGNELYCFVPAKSTVWEKIEIETPNPLNTISRIAISPDGKKIALVISE